MRKPHWLLQMIQQYIRLGYRLKTVYTSNLFVCAAMHGTFRLAPTQQGTYIVRFETVEKRIIGTNYVQVNSTAHLMPEWQLSCTSNQCLSNSTPKHQSSPLT